MVTGLLEKGWAHWPVDADLLGWLRTAATVAARRVADPAEQAEWLHCEGTWFVGVDTLPNDADGVVESSGPLRGAAYAAAEALYGKLALHRAQISVIYPGYPRPRTGESEGAFRYRQRRDAAHVDGLLAVGPQRRRMLKERHAYILGLPMTRCSAEASPLVVWEGSHEIMRAAFRQALGDRPEDTWAEVDLTEVYQQTRKHVFETCRRVTIPAQPGEAYLVHRLALHGVAPWSDAAIAPPEGRMIAYFRPEWPEGSRNWLEAP
jgi:hypothetical protein